MARNAIPREVKCEEETLFFEIIQWIMLFVRILQKYNVTLPLLFLFLFLSQTRKVSPFILS